MLTSKKCFRNSKCKPLSNISTKDKKDFVCIGLHNEIKTENNDIFRHCFKNIETDTIYDYDKYDLISVISVFSEALLIDELCTTK